MHPHVAHSIDVVEEAAVLARAKPRSVPDGTHRAPPQRSEPKELWIAAHLPSIAIEALQVDTALGDPASPQSPGRADKPGMAGGPSSSQPIAVVERQERTQWIIAVDGRAQRAGVCPGMTLAAALALDPELQVKPRDSRREQSLLESLATCAQRFTSRVSIVSPDGLLLEVKGSLNLFGGAKKLGRSVVAEFRNAGARPVIALAPTPLAAMAGARAGKSFIVTNESQLIGRMADMPLEVLRWPPAVLDRLSKVGVRSIGQVLRLPRAGFARRFGQQHLAALDRLTGRSADLRKEFRARERFRKRCDLTYEIEHHEGVLEVLEPLLQELELFLRGRQCGVTLLECRLRHRHAPPTRCILRLASPDLDAKRLKALFGERLPTLVLPEPVRACELRSGDLVPRTMHADSLWQPGEHGGGVGAESPAFIERLRARLGADAVYGLQMSEEHRPEAAWRVVEPGATPVPAAACDRIPWPAFRRPLWLLPEPQPLSERDRMPRYRGPLRLSGEPERVETGWWDGKGIARDYYQAVDGRGVRLWIFRERTAPHGWFLHGIFG